MGRPGVRDVASVDGARSRDRSVGRQADHDEVDRLFADGVPDDAPDDPIERQQYLAALAVLSCCGVKAAAPGGPRSWSSSTPHRPTLVAVDWDLPVDLPLDALRDVADRAKTHVVAVWPPADLDLGRRQRLATAAQRRVLRGSVPDGAQFPAVPCGSLAARSTTSGEWEHGGPTDLDNLLPICSSHHQIRARQRLEAQAAARPHARDHASRRHDDDDRSAEPWAVTLTVDGHRDRHLLVFELRHLPDRGELPHRPGW